VDDAEAQYLAFFASKTVGMIRAPDSYVYPAPFNIIEVVFIAPFEVIPWFSLNTNRYAKLNRVVMSGLFFIPMAIIALYESSLEASKNRWVRDWFTGLDQGEEDNPENQDPEIDGDLSISKVPFSELVKGFPNLQQSSEATILTEIKELRGQLDAVLKKLDAMGK